MIHRLTYVISVIAFAFSLGCRAQRQNELVHEVKPGETLYGLSVKYGVSVDDLRRENGLSSNSVIAGQKIRIAQLGVSQDDDQKQAGFNCRLMYEVQKKETVYSICKKFDLTEEELYAANPILNKKKLKKKQLICIPFKNVDEPVSIDVESTDELNVEPIKIAVVLPFGLSESAINSTNMKMLDFYEGFLLALESFKSTGLSAEIYAYDESEIDSVGADVWFSNGIIKDVDLIVGPYGTEYLDSFVTFANNNDVKMFVPFTAQADCVSGNPNVFQLNVPQASFYAKVYECFFEANKGKKLIFLLADDRTDNVLYFEGFKNYANKLGVNYDVVHMASMENLGRCFLDVRDCVCVPVSATEKSFVKMVNAIETLEGLDSLNISMFGQPNWQQFVLKHKDEFTKYDCSFFSKFYYDSSDDGVLRFCNDFNRAFGREQYPSYPMYGLMGYDMGGYFLKAFKEYGQNFTNELSGYSCETLQTPLRFEQKEEGSGFYNSRVMFLSVGIDGGILKKVY
jgi:LysM repeat protein